MLGAGLGWLAFSVVVDLVELAGSPQVVDLDQRIDRLVPAVVVGFAIQVLTGALSYLLPVVFGRGAYGNRKLTGVLEAAWPLRVAAVNLGVVLLVAGSSGGWVARAGWWLALLGLGAFVPLAAAVLAWRLVEDAGPAHPSAEARLAAPTSSSGRATRFSRPTARPGDGTAGGMASQPARPRSSGPPGCSPSIRPAKPGPASSRTEMCRAARTR
jgi:nitrite reductase (NO-forming)